MERENLCSFINESGKWLIICKERALIVAVSTSVIKSASHDKALQNVAMKWNLKSHANNRKEKKINKRRQMLVHAKRQKAATKHFTAVSAW